MRVNIGPYPSWVGPYQIAEALLGWPDDKWSDNPGWRRRAAHKLGDWLSNTPLLSLCNWIESKRKRRVYVQLDRWDHWNADVTLAHVILPVLLKLRETKHGAPLVDDADVPPHLQSTAAQPKEHEWDTDTNHFLRWEWVLGEMIWSFQQKLNPDWDAQYHTGEIDFQHTPVDAEGNPTTADKAKYYRMDRGPNDTYQCDEAGLAAANARLQRGFELFGKYYQSLWD